MVRCVICVITRHPILIEIGMEWFKQQKGLTTAAYSGDNLGHAVAFRGNQLIQLCWARLGNRLAPYCAKKGCKSKIYSLFWRKDRFFWDRHYEQSSTVIRLQMSELAIHWQL